MNRLKLWPAAGFILAVCANAQPTQCNQFQFANTVIRGPQMINKQPACNTWVLQWWTTAATVSIELDSAPDNGSNAPGAWSIVGGAPTFGTNPSTALNGMLILQTYAPWISVNITALTGSGTVNWILNGSAGIGSFATIPANADPCDFKAWNYYVVNVTTNTQIVAGLASNNVYVCQFFLAPVPAAANVNIVESSTSGNACATAPTGMMGGATAALGANLSINGGFVLPGTVRAWMKTATAGDAVCIFTSAQVSGVLSWVQNNP